LAGQIDAELAFLHAVLVAPSEEGVGLVLGVVAGLSFLERLHVVAAVAGGGAGGQTGQFLVEPDAAGFVAVALVALGLLDELAHLLADIARQLDGGVPLAVVAAEDHQLTAVEQVRQLRRVNLVDADIRADAKLEVSEDRMADLAIEAAHLRLNVLRFTDIS